MTKGSKSGFRFSPNRKREIKEGIWKIIQNSAYYVFIFFRTSYHYSKIFDDWKLKECYLCVYLLTFSPSFDIRQSVFLQIFPFILKNFYFAISTCKVFDFRPKKCISNYNIDILDRICYQHSANNLDYYQHRPGVYVWCALSVRKDDFNDNTDSMIFARLTVIAGVTTCRLWQWSWRLWPCLPITATQLLQLSAISGQNLKESEQYFEP